MFLPHIVPAFYDYVCLQYQLVYILTKGGEWNPQDYEITSVLENQYTVVHTFPLPCPISIMYLPILLSHHVSCLS